MDNPYCICGHELTDWQYHNSQCPVYCRGAVAACEPFLKQQETPAQCIARNRKDAAQALKMCSNAMKRAEQLEKVLQEIAECGCDLVCDDDTELCSTLAGYSHESWCQACLAQEALEEGG